MYVSTFKIILFTVLFIALKTTAQKPVELAQQVFNNFKKKNYSRVDALFDTTGILNFITTTEKANYKKGLEELGKPKKLLQADESENGTKTHIALGIEFKKEKKTVYILFNAKQKIEHITFGKYTEMPFFQLKGYKGFSEVTDLTTEVKTRDGLVLPANIAFGDTSKQKSALVIFVHGSGPGDRDETVGPNKPFRDLAQGLAQQGIVSLRYDKRTFAYQYDAKLMSDSMTLYEETINDAIDAVQTARQFTFVDTSRIYIVGHSQGAMCAPKIAELCSEIKGIVMLAGPSGSLVDIIPQQIEYIAMLDDSISTTEQMQITSVKWMVEKIKSPTLSNKTPRGMLMGGSALYWKSILNYHQTETAQKLSLPVYILNGERDYQVTMQQFNAWKDILKDHKNVQFASYPKLNHLFLEGGGKPGPAEYDIPGHIPQYVIDDLVKFIKN